MRADTRRGMFLMSQPESRLSRKIMEWLRAQGAFVWKNHGGPTMMAGLPDITGVYHGQFIAVETKMPGQQPTVIQRHRHDRIRQAGGLVVVAHSVEEVAGWFEAVVKPRVARGVYRRTPDA